LRHQGKHPYNAETTIDFKTGSVSFNYPQTRSKKNDWHGYSNHNVAQLLGALLGVFLIVKTFPTLVPFTVYLFRLYYNVSMISTFFLSMGIGALWANIIIRASVKTVGAISLILHLNSKYLRDMYPKTNAFLTMGFKWLRKKLGVKRTIDFSKKPFDQEIAITKKFLFTDNKLFIKTNIIYDEFELTGDCSEYINKIYTKCIEDDKKREKVDVSKFVTVFEFSRKPSLGRVIIH